VDGGKALIHPGYEKKEDTLKKGQKKKKDSITWSGEVQRVKGRKPRKKRKKD